MMMKLVASLCAALLLLCAPVFASSAGPAVTADQALTLLKEGNGRFVADKEDHPNQGFTARAQTSAKGQTPFACVLSCSDSRAPVEILFDRGIGDIFVIRVAGNVANIDEIASMEYGTDHLNVPLLVVLGHSQCGAVTAVAQKAEAHGNIPYLLKSIIPAVETAKKQDPKASGETLVNLAIKANIWQAIEDIFKNSPVIGGRVKDGKLKVIGASYQLDTGKVTWLGEHPNQSNLIPAAAEKGAH
jgi:carbonic anhydrase